MKTRTFSIRLSNIHDKQLRQLARLEHRKRGDVVRQLIEAAVQQLDERNQANLQVAKLNEVTK